MWRKGWNVFTSLLILPRLFVKQIWYRYQKWNSRYHFLYYRQDSFCTSCKLFLFFLICLGPSIAGCKPLLNLVFVICPLKRIFQFLLFGPMRFSDRLWRILLDVTPRYLVIIPSLPFCTNDGAFFRHFLCPQPF